MLEYFEKTRRLAQKYKTEKFLTVASFQNIPAFLLVFMSNSFFYRLGVFILGVFTPIFAR